MSKPKIDRLLGEERRRGILAVLGRNGRITVEEVVRRFGVSAVTARGDLAAHQQAEHVGGGGRVLDPDPAQGAVPGIHGGLGQLGGVHLAQALVALDRLLPPLAAPLQLQQRPVQLGVGVRVPVLVLALARADQPDPVQRRQGDAIELLFKKSSNPAATAPATGCTGPHRGATAPRLVSRGG